VCDASFTVGTVNIINETILFFMLKNFKSLSPIKGNSVSDCASFARVIISVKGGYCDYSPVDTQTYLAIPVTSYD
jgi:hypothetical protein